LEAVLSPLRDGAGEGAASDEEPPSLIVGRDDENHWVVVEAHGRCGGIFATEAAAVRYAREESRGRADLVSSATWPVVFNLGRSPARNLSRS
jgi:hypothetical protein